MIILDTNVLSALMRTKPDHAVLSWVDRQPAESMWLTSITVFEVEFGLNLMAPGTRRDHLESAFARMIRGDFQGRVLSFDQPAAEKAAILGAQRQRAGTPVDFRDTEIAGIVLARRAVLATRNLRHFEDAGIPLINPWGT
jgi:toxin FitB